MTSNVVCSLGRLSLYNKAENRVPFKRCRGHQDVFSMTLMNNLNHIESEKYRISNRILYIHNIQRRPFSDLFFFFFFFFFFVCFLFFVFYFMALS